MKIYEIVSEQQQVNELLGAIPGVTKAADYVSKAYKGYQRGKDLKAAQAARKARTAKNIFGQYKYSIKGLTGKERLDMLAKRATASANARNVAVEALNANTNWATLIRILGAGAVFVNYLMQISAIEDDFIEIRDTKEGKEVSPDNIFGGMQLEEAKEKGQQLRQDLLGEASIQLLALGIGGKLIASAGDIIKNFGVLGQVLGTGVKGFAFIAGLGGQGAKMTALKAGLTAWFSTESGQEFLKQTSIGLLAISAGQLVKSVLGPAASWTVDTVVGLADQAAQFIKAQTGLDINVPDTVKSPFSTVSPDQATKDAEAERAANVKFVGGVPATTADGYLRNDRAFWLTPNLGIIARRNANNNQPHPLQGLPLNPKLTYPSDLMAKVGFTPS